MAIAGAAFVQVTTPRQRLTTNLAPPRRTSRKHCCGLTSLGNAAARSGCISMHFIDGYHPDLFDNVMFSFLCFDLLLLIFVYSVVVTVVVVVYSIFVGCGFSIFVGCCFVFVIHAAENDDQDEQCRHSSFHSFHRTLKNNSGMTAAPT